MKKRAFKSNDVLKRNPNLKFKLVKEYDIFSGRIKIYSILDEYRNEKLFQKLYIPRNDIVEYFKCNSINMDFVNSSCNTELTNSIDLTDYIMLRQVTKSKNDKNKLVTKNYTYFSLDFIYKCVNYYHSPGSVKSKVIDYFRAITEEAKKYYPDVYKESQSNTNTITSIKTKNVNTKEIYIKDCISNRDDVLKKLFDKFGDNVTEKNITGIFDTVIDNTIINAPDPNEDLLDELEAIIKSKRSGVSKKEPVVEEVTEELNDSELFDNNEDLDCLDYLDNLDDLEDPFGSTISAPPIQVNEEVAVQETEVNERNFMNTIKLSNISRFSTKMTDVIVSIVKDHIKTEDRIPYDSVDYAWIRESLLCRATYATFNGMLFKTLKETYAIGPKEKDFLVVIAVCDLIFKQGWLYHHDNKSGTNIQFVEFNDGEFSIMGMNVSRYTGILINNINSVLLENSFTVDTTNLDQFTNMLCEYCKSKLLTTPIKISSVEKKVI